LIKPKFGCSTKAIYSKVKKFSRPKFLCPSRKMFDLDFLNQMNNSLEHVAFLQYPKLRQLKFSIEKLTSPIFVRMTGSGSTLVAYFASKKVCENAKKNFYKKYKNYWCIASKTI
jgi:4-diphosphocytidyl-2-C-methyl-D-erythritol kinase